ncbi:tetratricopeptide repeat protein [Pseudomonas sp. LB3P93]
MNFNSRWLYVFLLLVSSAWGEGKKLACDPDTNVCSVAIAENYCGPDGVAKSKWDIRGGDYVLSCECDCTTQENIFWFVSQDGKVKTLEASKVVSAADIVKNKSGVPDSFGAVPYCKVIKTNHDRLVYLQKGPSASESSQPYCYSVVEQDAAEACTTEDCMQKKGLVEKTVASLKGEILTEFKNATSRLYKNKEAFVSFPKRGFIEKYIIDYGYSSGDQQSFNDIAYFWQQAGFNEDAIWLLGKVIADNPKRVVAYLNIADAYWSEGDKATAAKNYKAYNELMIAGGKQQKIPERSKERSVLK